MLKFIKDNNLTFKKLFIFSLSLLLVFVNLFADENKKAPDFKLQDVQGKQVSLSDFTDKLIVLDFWATWCVPCKKAMKELDKIQTKYTEQVKIIAISIDKPRAKAKAVSYVKSRRFSFVTLFDPDWRVKRKYNVVNPPRTLVITPEKNIIYEHDGYKRGDEKKLEKIIKEWISKREKTKNEKVVDTKQMQGADSIKTMEKQDTTKVDSSATLDEKTGVKE